MEGKERDQRAYEKVKPHLPGLLLNIVLQMVEELRDHYRVRPKQASLVAVVNSRVRGQAAPMQSLLDILVVEPARAKGGVRPSMFAWNEGIALAAEVEVDPTKHMDWVYINWKKNRSMGLGVWFIVFSEEHRRRVVQTLSEAGIAESEYHMDVAGSSIYWMSAAPVLHGAPLLPGAEIRDDAPQKMNL